MGTRLRTVLLIIGLAVLPAAAQETRGNINGTIRDADGAVPGASVTITNVDTSQTQTLVTNRTGYFAAPLLTAGNYRVTVEMPGFSTLTQSLTLSVGASRTPRMVVSIRRTSRSRAA